MHALPCDVRACCVMTVQCHVVTVQWLCNECAVAVSWPCNDHAWLCRVTMLCVTVMTVHDRAWPGKLACACTAMPQQFLYTCSPRFELDPNFVTVVHIKNRNLIVPGVICFFSVNIYVCCWEINLEQELTRRLWDGSFLTINKTVHPPQENMERGRPWPHKRPYQGI